ncbi:hypothetical protein MTR67_017739 [Solanum verrucosum]|uniref:Uncharacterized protein n=1 Tax=Solanum verrucosum TaxID=315347 RepID=A0AAF0TM44_SOLVR|nr:hypothetical protein MTR67_017739 [Solanum verrucosum]
MQISRSYRYNPWAIGQPTACGGGPWMASAALPRKTQKIRLSLDLRQDLQNILLQRVRLVADELFCMDSAAEIMSGGLLKSIQANHFVSQQISDGSVLALDKKKEEGILIEPPKFIDHYVLNYGKILASRDMSGSDIWLGRAQGLLTLVCIFRKYIVIGTYDRASSCWRVSHTLDNFLLGLDGHSICIPVWIDNKQVSFLVRRPPKQYHDLYEYDTNINVYKNVAILDIVDYPMYCFHPTLAYAHKMPSNYVTTA